MWDSAGNSSWSYDEYGRTTTATRVVDGRSYASDYTYDALDRVRETTYPDNETLTYSYQANLLLDGIQSSIDSLDIVSDVVYEDIGLPDSYTLGSSPPPQLSPSSIGRLMMPAALPSPPSSGSSSPRTRPTWSTDRCSTMPPATSPRLWMASTPRR